MTNFGNSQLYKKVSGIDKLPDKNMDKTKKSLCDHLTQTKQHQNH